MHQAMKKRRLSGNDISFQVSTKPRNQETTIKINAVHEAVRSLIDHCNNTASYNDSPNDGPDSITMAFANLKGALSTLLIARAKILASKGKLRNAITDALNAIKYDPQSSAAYHTAGQLYSSQGSQQKAIEIYEQGLCATVPSESVSLYEQREKIKVRLEKKVDFVNILPLEIVANVFCHLVKEDLEIDQSLYVSMRWRKCILHDCGHQLWKSAYIGDRHTSNPSLRHISSIAMYIRTLHLDNPALFQLEQLVKMAQEKKFPLLNELLLEIETPFWNRTLEELPQYHPLALIKLIGKGLTKLSIRLTPLNDHYSDDEDEVNAANEETEFPLDTVIDSCTNLQEFGIELDSDSDVYITCRLPPPSDHDYKLKRLSLNINNGNTDSGEYQVLERMLPRCPHLLYLDICETESNVVQLVQKYFPTGLKEISLDYYRSIRDNRVLSNNNDFLLESAQSVQQRSVSPTTIGSAGLNCIDYSFMTVGDLERVEPIIISNKETLETLNIFVQGCSYYNNEPYDIAYDGHLLRTLLSRLKKLSLNGTSCASWCLSGVMAPMLQNCCPQVEKLSIDFFGDSIKIPCDFLTSSVNTTTLPMLRDLTLHRLYSSTLILDDFFAQHAKCGVTSHLRRIVLSECIQITDNTLATLADVVTLETIQLEHLSGEYKHTLIATTTTVEGVVLFFKKLERNQNLKILTLVDVPKVTDDALFFIANYVGLEVLKLSLLHEITDKGIHRLADAMIHPLRGIYIDMCAHVTTEAIEYFNCMFSYR
ncbi:hypothetical protein BDA99DRAFT_527923 [Phascolomyces articulosus]|uniref:F-box domain-containing protein n=1 Tax=Phascolomyces articulosus TaxID=60185 RepID=A0AAD5JWN4_9FUNG|nr:hypothetical protein BDA99DRAFT_527923 [Phascolomyces articulosus]